jgi:cobyric acid synthase
MARRTRSDMDATSRPISMALKMTCSEQNATDAPRVRMNPVLLKMVEHVCV